MYTVHFSAHGKVVLDVGERIHGLWVVLVKLCLAAVRLSVCLLLVW